MSLGGALERLRMDPGDGRGGHLLGSDKKH